MNSLANIKLVSLKEGFSDPFADVDIAPVNVAGEAITNKVAVRVRLDDGTWCRKANVLSGEYRLIHNKIARDVADDVMSRSPWEWGCLKTMWDGKRYASFHATKLPVVSVHISGLAVGMMIRNSYDGSGVFGLEIFAMYMQCTNQMHDRNRFGFFAIRHDSGNKFDVQDALQNLEKGAANIIAAGPKVLQLREQQVDTHDILLAHEKTKMPSSKWGDVLTKYREDKDTSMFGLFQAMRFVSSHMLTGFNSTTISESIVKHFI